jgi:hypothetical protein
VPKLVGEHMPQTGTPTGRTHDGAHPRRGELAVWGPASHEHRSVLGCGGSAPAQVTLDRFADVHGQRQLLGVVALAAHPQLAGPPVDVVQAQRGDLTGAQAQPDQHEQDREVTSTPARTPVTASEQPGDLSVLKGLR